MSEGISSKSDDNVMMMTMIASSHHSDHATSREKDLVEQKQQQRQQQQCTRTTTKHHHHHDIMLMDDPNNTISQDNVSRMMMMMTYELMKECLEMWHERQPSRWQHLSSSSSHHDDDDNNNHHDFLSWWSALYHRCQQLDEWYDDDNNHQQEQSSSLRRQLLSCHESDKYTPLHDAIYHGDIHVVLFLLYQSASSHHDEITTTTIPRRVASASSSHHGFVPMKSLIQFLLSERVHTTTTSSSSSNLPKSPPPPSSSFGANFTLSHLICRATDAEGYTPGALLAQLQKRQLSYCRKAIGGCCRLIGVSSSIDNDETKQEEITEEESSALYRSSSRRHHQRHAVVAVVPSTPRRREPHRQPYHPHHGDNRRHQELDYQTQNELELLSRALQESAAMHHHHNNEEEEEAEEASVETSSDEIGPHQDDEANHYSYGCEVLTFGSAHHCVRGVASTNTSTTTTNKRTESPGGTNGATTATTTTSMKHQRPQRVMEFALDVCRSNHNGAIYVAASTYHTLVVTEQGHLYSFGLGKSGRLGTGSEAPCSRPVRVGGIGGASTSLLFSQLKIIHVAAAENHSLAVTSHGVVYAWGSNRFGQLGLTTTTNSNSTTASTTTNSDQVGGSSNSCSYWPRRVDELKGMACIQVAAGLRHSVALTNDGAVYVWGDNSSGQLGISAPVAHQTKVHLVTSLWGSNVHHQHKSKPKHHSSSSSHYYDKKIIVKKIAASDYATLALGWPHVSHHNHRNVNHHQHHVVYAWGHGNHVPYKVNFIDPTIPSPSQQHGGKGTTTKVVVENNDDTMNRYDAAARFRRQYVNPVDIACARYHNVAITDDGRVFTWGLHADSLGTLSSPRKSATPPSQQPNNNHQHQPRFYMTEPQLVYGMLPEYGGGYAVAVAAAENHTAVVTDVGDLFTWGESYHDHVLGHVGTRYQPSPKRVAAVHRAVAVAVAKEHTVILMGTSFPSTKPAMLLSSSQTSSSSSTMMIPTLESIAAMKIMDHIDMFNILPIYLMAQRMQTPMLVRYCHDFIRNNFDGVLNVAQKSVLDMYVKERIIMEHDPHHNGFLSRHYHIMNSHHNHNKYRDSDWIHPILSDLLMVGCASSSSLSSSVLTSPSSLHGVTNKRNNYNGGHLRRQQKQQQPNLSSSSFCFMNSPLCPFHSWTKLCHDLSMEPQFHSSLRMLQAMADENEIGNNYSHHSRRSRLRSLSNASDTSIDEKKKHRTNRPSGWLSEIRHSNVSTIEMCQEKLSYVNKEIRAIRKRLGQIERLEAGKVDVVGVGVGGGADDDDRIDISRSDDSGPLRNLTWEQKQKIARRPQLQSDLASLGKCKVYLEQRMQELRSIQLVASAKDIVRSIEREEESSHRGDHEEAAEEVIGSSSSGSSLISSSVITKQFPQRKVSFAEDLMMKPSESSTRESLKDVKNQIIIDVKSESTSSCDDATKKSCASDMVGKEVPLVRYVCECCHVTCPDQKSLDLHKAGRKHRNKLAQLEEDDKRKAALTLKAEQQKRHVMTSSHQTKGGKASPSSSNSQRSACPWAVASSNVDQNQPRFKLPPPPHPIADTIVVNEKVGESAVWLSSSSSPAIAVAGSTTKKKNLKEIMEEEALISSSKTASPKMTTNPTKKLFHGSSGARSVDKLQANSSSGSWLVPPPSAFVPMKSVPWAKTPPIHLSTNDGVASSNSFVKPTTSREKTNTGMPTTNNRSTKTLTSSQTTSLGDFLPVLQSPVSKSTSESKAKPSPARKVPQNPPTLQWNVAPPVADVPTKSLLEIQHEEQESKHKLVDHTTYAPDGQNKWFVEQRKRADSFQEIQSEARRLEEERLMIEEQMKIERQIYADIEAAKKMAEASEKKKKHHNKNRYKSNHSKATKAQSSSKTDQPSREPRTKR